MHSANEMTMAASSRTTFRLAIKKLLSVFSCVSLRPLIDVVGRLLMVAATGSANSLAER